MDKSFLSLSINLVRFRRRTTSDNKFSLILSNRLLFQMNFPSRVFNFLQSRGDSFESLWKFQSQSSSTFDEEKSFSDSQTLLLLFFSKVRARKMFQWKSIDRSIDPPEGSKDLVLLSRKVFGRQKRGKTRSEGRSARVTVTGFVHDWPGFFGVTQVYIQKAGLCIDARSLVVSR